MWRERKRGWIFDGFGAPDVRQAVLFFDNLLVKMDAILARHEWLTGDTYTMADSALTPYVNRLDMLGFTDMWSPHRHLKRWFDQIRNRPSFEPALFQYLPEDLRNDMRSRGEREAQRSKNYSTIRPDSVLKGGKPCLNSIITGRPYAPPKSGYTLQRKGSIGVATTSIS